MAEKSETKLNPAEEQRSSTEPKLAKDETNLATSKAADEGKEDDSATDKASKASTDAKDSMFSMFGGGEKKQRAEEDDADADKSGSSKRKEGDEVSQIPLPCEQHHRRRSQNPTFPALYLMEIPPAPRQPPAPTDLARETRVPKADRSN